MQTLQKRENAMRAMLAVTAVLITVTGIRFKQSVFRMIPLYISLFIALFQSKVDRKAHLIGSINSLFYAAVNFSLKLYASFLSALLFSFPVQLVSYFSWKKNGVGNTVRLRTMTKRGRIILALLFTACYAVSAFAAGHTDSDYPRLDTLVSLLGILVSFLVMYAYAEYSPLMVLSDALSVLLYLLMMRRDMAQITYLIFSTFRLICQIQAFVNVCSLLKEQQNERLPCRNGGSDGNQNQQN